MAKHAKWSEIVSSTVYNDMIVFTMHSSLFISCESYVTWSKCYLQHC